MLYERLLGRTDAGVALGEGRIPVHAFVGLMAERARGRVTNADVIAMFGLSTEDQAELVTLVGRFTTGGSRLTREELEDVLYVGSSKLASVYGTPSAVRARLGV